MGFYTFPRLKTTNFSHRRRKREKAEDKSRLWWIISTCVSRSIFLLLSGPGGWPCKDINGSLALWPLTGFSQRRNLDRRLDGWKKVRSWCLLLWHTLWGQPEMAMSLFFSGGFSLHDFILSTSGIFLFPYPFWSMHSKSYSPWDTTLALLVPYILATL